jgi:hypothetical protein
MRFHRDHPSRPRNRGVIRQCIAQFQFPGRERMHGRQSRAWSVFPRRLRNPPSSCCQYVMKVLRRTFGQISNRCFLVDALSVCRLAYRDPLGNGKQTRANTLERIEGHTFRQWAGSRDKNLSPVSDGKQCSSSLYSHDSVHFQPALPETCAPQYRYACRNRRQPSAKDLLPTH